MMGRVHAVVDVTFGAPGNGGRHDLIVGDDDTEDLQVRDWMPRTGILALGRSTSDDPPIFDVRWWSRHGEIELCGSGAMAMGGYLLAHRVSESPQVVLKGRFHQLTVSRNDVAGYRVRLPHFRLESRSLAPELRGALRVDAGSNCVLCHELRTYLIELPPGSDIAAVSPDFECLRQLQMPDLAAVVVTAQPLSGASFDFRYFTPWHGVDESPVAASAHAVLGPYWRARTGSARLSSQQQSPAQPVFEVYVDDGGTWFGGDTAVASICSVSPQMDEASRSAIREVL